METSVGKIWKPGSLQGADAIAEGIAARDLNNLYRVSCYFASLERYRAFCAFYAVMRIVDDRVDKCLMRRDVSAEEKRRELLILRAWHRAVSASLSGRSPSPRDIAQCDYPYTAELLYAFAESVRQFPVPEVLWDDFFAAMEQDLEQGRFATYSEFVDYAGGATVAPTTIYLYLITAERRDGECGYHPPQDFDLIRCGRELGLFAYISHILRDLRQDLAAGDQGLSYLAADDMATHGLTEQILLSDLVSGSASLPLRGLVRDLVERARMLLNRGRACLRVLDGELSSDRAFVLELIVLIYEKIIEKIMSCSYDVMTGRHRLTTAEKEKITLDLLAQRRERIDGVTGRN